MASSPHTQSPTLHSILARPLAHLSLPPRIKASSLGPSNEISNALKYDVEVHQRRGLTAMYNVGGMFSAKVLEFMSSRFPNPTLDDLSESSHPDLDLDDITELDVSPRELKRNAALVPAHHSIEHTRYAVQTGVLGSAKAILHAVFQRQFEKKNKVDPKTSSHQVVVDREPFHPYAPEKDVEARRKQQEERENNNKLQFPALSSQRQTLLGSQANDASTSSSEFQWDLYSASYVHDADNTIAVVSWSAEPLRDPTLFSESDFNSDGTRRPRNDEENVDCRVLFFVFGAWEVNNADFRAFVSQRTMRNRSSAKGVVRRYPSPGDRMWGFIYDRCVRVNCRWFVVTTHDNWTFGVFSKEWTTAFLSEPIPYNSAPPPISSSSPPPASLSSSRLTKTPNPNPNPSVLQGVLYWIMSAMGCEGAWEIDEVGALQRAISAFSSASLPAPSSSSLSFAPSTSSSSASSSMKREKEKEKEREERRRRRRRAERKKRDEVVRGAKVTSTRAPVDSSRTFSSPPRQEEEDYEVADGRRSSSSASPNKRKRSITSSETDVEEHNDDDDLVVVAGGRQPKSKSQSKSKTSSPSPRKKHRPSPIAVPHLPLTSAPSSSSSYSRSSSRSGSRDSVSPTPTAIASNSRSPSPPPPQPQRPNRRRFFPSRSGSPSSEPSSPSSTTAVVGAPITPHPPPHPSLLPTRGASVGARTPSLKRFAPERYDDDGEQEAAEGEERGKRRRSGERERGLKTEELGTVRASEWVSAAAAAAARDRSQGSRVLVQLPLVVPPPTQSESGSGPSVRRSTHSQPSTSTSSTPSTSRPASNPSPSIPTSTTTPPEPERGLNPIRSSSSSSSPPAPAPAPPQPTSTTSPSPRRRSILDWMPKKPTQSPHPFSQTSQTSSSSSYDKKEQEQDPIWLRKPIRCFPLRVGDFFGRARAGALACSMAGSVGVGLRLGLGSGSGSGLGSGSGRSREEEEGRGGRRRSMGAVTGERGGRNGAA